MDLDWSKKFNMSTLLIKNNIEEGLIWHVRHLGVRGYFLVVSMFVLSATVTGSDCEEDDGMLLFRWLIVFDIKIQLIFVYKSNNVVLLSVPRIVSG